MPVVRGLSPRVRGNPEAYGFAKRLTRSIPACAGEPYDSLERSMRNAVYPRVCGGTFASGAYVYGGQGLSPRVRGNLVLPQRNRPRVRSIPACAGEPPPYQLVSQLFAVYPRVCGGTLDRLGVDLRLRGLSRVCGGTGATSVETAKENGLSPRVRGNRGIALASDRRIGSIPACAGEPFQRRVNVL